MSAATAPAAPAKRAIQTDVSRPARLPTGRLGLGNLRGAGERKGDASGAGGGGRNEGTTGDAVPSQQHLDVLAENANKMIDDEISALLDGFKTIVQLGTVSVASLTVRVSPYLHRISCAGRRQGQIPNITRQPPNAEPRRRHGPRNAEPPSPKQSTLPLTCSQQDTLL
jgi:hypothetical protein